MLAPWIIQHFPAHEIYVEPFGGAGSVLLRKPRSRSEVYNDLDSEVVNVFRVLRDPILASRLQGLLELTPFARDEFYDCYKSCTDPVEMARRTIAKSFMAFGTTSRRANRTGFRGKAYRHNQTGVGDWVNYPSAISAFTDRFRGVCIENRPAIDVIRQQDGPDVLFYLDPPYPISTRSSIRTPSDRDRAYVHDMDDAMHVDLAAALHDIAGMAIISGYASELYDKLLFQDWRRVEKETFADGGARRTEVLWLNENCHRALTTHKHPLFE